MTKKLTLIAAALALVAAACGGDDDGGTDTTATPTTQATTVAPTTSAPTAAPATAEVIVTGSSLGDILADQMATPCTCSCRTPRAPAYATGTVLKLGRRCWKELQARDWTPDCWVHRLVMMGPSR